MSWARMNPYRMKRGQAQVNNAAALLSIVSLYNNSPANEVLAVMDLQSVQGGNVTYVIGNAAGVPVGSLVTTAGPLWPDRGDLAGQLYTNNTQAALPGAATWAFGQQGNYGAVWFHEWPIAIVLPGQYLFVSQNVVNVTSQFSMMWQVLRMDELEHLLSTSAPPAV